ncbi:hypothetical protein FNF29_05646 [Cafeteria roenbergensis]|uniref:Glycosyl transferase family 1 domain-containing protein n=1 Tax=Cafeteria roenbergensis TaxID=33653 RepID=A0A5A8CCN6_CAFRO|nr:hypothetical protein FNF29_05646 [Cafeteria roenbergensis]|eukprot:KAA0149820.1 hypothetical protein FNF29_05646 [Cafeteria roenbergensis]
MASTAAPVLAASKRPIPPTKGSGGSLAPTRTGSDWSLATLDPEAIPSPDTSGNPAGLPPMARKPVALCSHSLERNGANNCVLFLATRLAEDQRVLIITPKDGPMREDFEALGCDVIHLPTEVAGYEAKMRDVIRECGLVLANTMMRAEVVCLAKEVAVPSLWVIHEAWPRDQMKEYAEKTFLTSHITPDVIGEAFTKASKIVFPAHVQRQLYDGLFDDARASVVYNGIPLGKLDAAVEAMDRDAERAKLGVSKDDFLILHLGTICKRKAQINTARAFTRLVKRDGLTNAKLVLVGARYIRQHEIDYIEEIKKVLADAGLADRVVILDIQKDVRRFYLAADVIVVPSLNEVLPLVICESMAMRRPVVASKIDGIPEALSDGEEGLLIRPGSATAIADAVAKLYRDPALRAAMGRRGRERVLRQFSFSAMTSEYRGIIDALAVAPAKDERTGPISKAVAMDKASSVAAAATGSAAATEASAADPAPGLRSVYGSTPELDARGPGTPALSVWDGTSPSPLFTPSFAGSVRSAASFGSLSSLRAGGDSEDEEALHAAAAAARGEDSDAASDFSAGGTALSASARNRMTSVRQGSWASGSAARRQSRRAAAGLSSPDPPSLMSQPFATLVQGAPVLVIPPDALLALSRSGNSIAVPLDAAIAAGLAPKGTSVPPAASRPVASPANSGASAAIPSPVSGPMPTPPMGTQAMAPIAEAHRPAPAAGPAAPASMATPSWAAHSASGGSAPPARPVSAAASSPAARAGSASSTSSGFMPTTPVPAAAATAAAAAVPRSHAMGSVAGASGDTSMGSSRPSAGVVLVDMDSTLVDFDAAFIERWVRKHPDRAELDSAMIRSRALYELEANFPVEMRESVLEAIAEPGLFLAMPPIEGAVESMRAMLEAGFDVRILTAPHPSCYAACAAEKFAWVQEHMGIDWCSRLIIARDKTHIQGAILIDDKPSVTGSQEPKWQHVLFSQPWNRHISDTPRMSSWHEWPQTVVQVLAEQHKAAEAKP